MLENLVEKRLLGQMPDGTRVSLRTSRRPYHDLNSHYWSHRQLYLLNRGLSLVPGVG
jgi:hypothetical protein